ncbi:lipopolysaccharide biosynthesis protein [Streptomyces sp. NPDC058953]|uniref:lipopolysaccharide biosynthesis protein n=1 Tax=unclassified Streptomyces TaxID=2593676 RepID=UPI003698E581
MSKSHKPQEAHKLREHRPERAEHAEQPEQAEPSRLAARVRRIPVWWPLPALAVAGAIGGAAYGLLATPEYAATSYIVAVTGKDAQPGAAIGFAQAYGRVATSDSTIAYARVAAAMPAGELRDRVRAETSPDSPMIAITGTSDRPGEAADIANAVSDAVFVSSNQVAKNTGVQLLSFSRAIPPADAVSPSVPVGTAVGASAGGLLGGLVLLVRPRSRRAAPDDAPADTGTDTVPGTDTGADSATATVPAPAGKGAAAAGLERV